MARYRKVDPRIWNDEKFRALTDNSKLVFFNIITHPSMTALGAMRGTIAGLAAEMGWAVARFRKAFTALTDGGMVEYNGDAAYIALPRWLRYNPPEGPNSVVKAWPEALDLIPECPERQALALRCLGYLNGMSDAFRQQIGQATSDVFRDAIGDAIPDAKTEPSPIQEQEQEQEPKQDQIQAATGNGLTANDLKALWNEIVRTPAVRELTRKRLAKAGARISEHPDPAWWRTVFEKIRSTPFLRGEKGWEASFDWVVANDTNAVKVAEGQYARAVRMPGPAATPTPRRSMADHERAVRDLASEITPDA